MSVLPVANNIKNPAVPVDNIYQSATNLRVSASRVLSKDNYRQGFMSMQLGSNMITLTMPSNALIGNVLINVSFLLTPGTCPLGWYLPQGWAYKMIRNIYWTYGGSETISITGHQNLMRHLCECEGDRKKTAVMSLGGASVYNNNGAMSPSGTNTIFSGSAVLYAPHSSVNAMKQIPFDTNLLGQNITIRIDLLSAEELWLSSTTFGDTLPVPLTDNQRKLNSGEFWVKTHQLIDTVASKKELVGPNGNYMQQYFFYYPQDFQSTVLNQQTQALDPISGVQNVILNGFKNGSLQSIVIYVERDPTNYGIEAAAAGDRPIPSYMQTYPLTNLQLEYAGNIIYRAQYPEAALLLDLCNNTTDATFTQTTYNRPAAAGAAQPPVPVTGSRSNFYRIQISQFSEVFRDYLQTGADISANIMTLSFQFIDPNIQLLTNPATANRRYFLRAQYVYQSSLAVRGGVGMFQWINPLPSPGPLMDGALA
jgi:hypothetical protein